MTEELENSVEISFHDLVLEIGKAAMPDKDAYAGFLKQAYSGLGSVMAGHILMHQSDTRYARALFEEGMLLGMTEMRSVFSRCCKLNDRLDPYAEPSHNELVATEIADWFAMNSSLEEMK